MSRLTPPSPREGDGPGRLLAVYGVFVVLVLLYTWPLALGLSTHLRRFFDVHYFVGVMGWVSRQIVASPRTVFDGHIFYPHGLSIAYSEPMLVPSILTFGPVYAVSGNPVLAYNVTIVLFQALAGWAGYYAARQLTGSRLAGWVAGIVFALSPLRVAYYHFAHTQHSFAMPLAFLAWARFLERQRARDLAGALFFLWCQLAAVINLGVPLALLLGALTLGFVLLRPRVWPPRAMAALLVGGLALAVAYLPVAWPYLQVRSEMGFERDLNQAGKRSSDLLSYLDAGPESRFYQLVESTTHPPLFPGFTVFALVLAAFALTPSPATPSLPRIAGPVGRLIGWGLGGTLAAIALFLATGGGTLEVLGLRLRMTEVDRATWLLLLLVMAWLALKGWAWARAPEDRGLSRREWVALLAFLTIVFGWLSLGPVMNRRGEPAGLGLYAWLYDVFPPMRATRLPHRMGFLVMLLLGLLAAFGLVALRARLAEGWWRRAVGVVPLLLLVEYVPLPRPYDVIRWDEPPPVYRWLAAQPGDFAVLEWPAGPEFPDASYGMWTLLHGKRLVNGSSGFDPPFTQEIRQALATLPDPAAVARIFTVYPLRFLLIHLELLEPAQQEHWIRLGQSPPPGLRVAADLGHALAFEREPGPDRARHWERTFSTDLVAARPQARVSVALTREDPDVHPTVEATFNGRPLRQLTPTVSPVDLRLSLPPPYPRVDRNVLRLQLTYRLRPQASIGTRYLIGRTAVHAPADLLVTSAGQGHGRLASILVNGTEAAPNLRGYNVVVLDPRSGEVARRDVFDTFRARTESARLAAFLGQVPSGWIVVAAIKDDGVGELGDDAVQAFRGLGGQVDPRGALFVSHLLVGVQGATPGTAVEAFGFERLARLVGEERAGLQLVARDFGLDSP